MRATVALVPVFALVAVALSACGSSDRPGGSFLYDDASPPRLLDATIEMQTYRTTRPDERPQRRMVAVQDGVIRASVDTGTRRGEGTLDVETYGALWRSLLDSGAFDLDREGPDPDGGYYHVILIRLGDQKNELSAQDHTNFLGAYDASIVRRLDIANAITETLQKLDAEVVPRERRAEELRDAIRKRREAARPAEKAPQGP